MFRRLKVIAKVRESRTITSFHLQPLDPQDWWPFEPGQFLVFKVPACNDRGNVLRNYSISSSPRSTGIYRITVKREGAPTPDVPDGVSSCHLHDQVAIGDELLAEGPRGEFRLDRKSVRPVLLLSGGVGLTPLVSMLHALAHETERRVYFIHACDSGDVHALSNEVRELTAVRPGITLHICYRFPSAADAAARAYDSEGIVTAEILRRVLPLDDYDIYLCGPPPFMQGMYRTLRELGVPQQRIAYEFFGPSTVLEATQDEAVEQPPAPAGAITVEFRKSGRSAAWEDSESLLDFAESQGLSPEFSCRAGICGSCKVALIEGEVDYIEEPLDAPADGQVLICSCKPRGSIVIDI